MTQWPWRQRAELCEPRRTVNTRTLGLQTAKEILAEVFHARPADVEEMIRMRPEMIKKRSRGENSIKETE